MVSVTAEGSAVDTVGTIKETIHLTVKRRRQAHHWADSQDDQGQFPAFREADDAGREEVGVGLDQHPHFVTYPLLDLVDVAARRCTNSSDSSLCMSEIQQWLRECAPLL